MRALRRVLVQVFVCVLALACGATIELSYSTSRLLTLIVRFASSTVGAIGEGRREGL